MMQSRTQGGKCGPDTIARVAASAARAALASEGRARLPRRRAGTSASSSSVPTRSSSCTRRRRRRPATIRTAAAQDLRCHTSWDRGRSCPPAQTASPFSRRALAKTRRWIRTRCASMPCQRAACAACRYPRLATPHVWQDSAEEEDDRPFSRDELKAKTIRGLHKRESKEKKKDGKRKPPRAAK